MQVFVCNKNNFTHADRYDGIDYVFEPNAKLAIPAEAAAHMFGFGRADKTENLIRLGWQNLPNDDGVKKLAKFVFLEAKLVEKEAQETKQDEDEEVIIPPVKKARPDSQKPA